jgi:hypothetical protein
MSSPAQPNPYDPPKGRETPGKPFSPATARTNPLWMTWLGWVLTVLPSLALIMSAGFKFSGDKTVTEGLAKMSWEPTLAVPLGITELLCTIIYLNPRTAVLGAVLLTGYMGGAIATHISLEESFAFQAAFGVVLWLGIFLREPRLRTILPWRLPLDAGKV